MSRPRLRSDAGFGLVELLVVMLIIGILAAVALPSLLTQRGKAQNANAKAAAATAALAATAFGTDRNGFTGVTPQDLTKIERSLGSARNLQVDATETTFEVRVESIAGTTYSISRAADGSLTRDCSPAGADGCPNGADARGNRW